MKIIYWQSSIIKFKFVQNFEGNSLSIFRRIKINNKILFIALAAMYRMSYITFFLCNIHTNTYIYYIIHA